MCTKSHITFYAIVKIIPLTPSPSGVNDIKSGHPEGCPLMTACSQNTGFTF